MVRQYLENHGCSAYVSFRAASVRSNGFSEMLSGYPGIASIFVDEGQQVLGVMIEADQRSKLAELVGSTVEIAERYGMTLRGLLTS
jgi:hypothetical protein